MKVEKEEGGKEGEIQPGSSLRSELNPKGGKGKKKSYQKKKKGRVGRMGGGGNGGGSLLFTGRR